MVGCIFRSVELTDNDATNIHNGTQARSGKV